MTQQTEHNADARLAFEPLVSRLRAGNRSLSDADAAAVLDLVATSDRLQRVVCDCIPEPTRPVRGAFDAAWDALNDALRAMGG